MLIANVDEPGTHLGSDLRITRHHARSHAHIRARIDFYSLPPHSVDPSRPPWTSNRPLRARSDHSVPYLSLDFARRAISTLSDDISTFPSIPRLALRSATVLGMTTTYFDLIPHQSDAFGPLNTNIAAMTRARTHMTRSTV